MFGDILGRVISIDSSSLIIFSYLYMEFGEFIFISIDISFPLVCHRISLIGISVLNKTINVQALILLNSFNHPTPNPCDPLR